MVEIVSQIDHLIDGTDLEYMETLLPNTMDVWTYTTKKIYFHLLISNTADNHFSGDNVMEFMGSKGYGFTVSCHRDCP